MEDGCNSGSDVIDQFTRLDEYGNPVELECYEFAGVRELPDGITGNLDGYPDLNDNVRKCPNFANWGCFAANFTEGEFSNSAVLAGFNKGLVIERSSTDGKVWSGHSVTSQKDVLCSNHQWFQQIARH